MAETPYLRFNETTWPDPTDPTDVEWQLRYGDPEKVRLVAASFVSAYAALVAMPQRRRSAVIRDLRECVQQAELHTIVKLAKAQEA